MSTSTEIQQIESFINAVRVALADPNTSGHLDSIRFNLEKIDAHSAAVNRRPGATSGGEAKLASALAKAGIQKEAADAIASAISDLIREKMHRHMQQEHADYDR